MQAKDIPDSLILDYLKKIKPIWACWYKFEGQIGIMVSLYNVVDASVPEKVLLAKMRSLIKRKLVKGCACGCRGDFTLA